MNLKKIPFSIIIGVVSFICLLVSSVMLFQLRKTGSILPTANLRANGIMYFDGEHKAAVQQPFHLKIMIDTQNQSVNAVGLKLYFEPNKLQISDISTTQSFCQFYPEKKFDNRQGIVSLACGAPHPGFKGKKEIIDLLIIPTVIGTSNISISNASKILLSNGKGTNILNGFPNWEVQVAPSL